MNANRLLTLSRFAVAAGLVAVSVGAHAGGGVNWVVNVEAPLQGLGYVSTSVSNGPGAVYVQPAPVYVQRAPVYVEPARVVYAPAPVYVQPRRVCEPRVVEYVRERPGFAPWWGWREHHREHEMREERMAWRDDRGERMIVMPGRSWDDGRDGRDGRDDDRAGRYAPPDRGDRSDHRHGH